MSFSPCLKGRISSPLEAGPSVADGHHLPSPVSEALEYASKRLGRKAAHITLLAVRRDYQLPTSPIASPTFTTASVPASTSTVSSPSKPSFPAASRLGALKQLVRSNNSGEGQIRERILHVHLDQFRNDTTSPAFSEASTVSSASTADSTFSHRVRRPGSPTTWGSVPVTPATPFTVMSLASRTEAACSVPGHAAQSPAQFGMKLVYAHPLNLREEKAVSQALEKAAKKFKLHPNWLPQAVSPSTLGLPVDLVWKSTVQNEPLFLSEHLGLLSLDRLYTFRTALQAYARTQAPSRLEDAVDELRRLFLANGRRALRKSALLAAYRWLDPVSDAALADVCRMYERAYGGIERESGVENDVDPGTMWPLAESNGDLGGGAEQSIAKRMGTAVPGSQGLQYAPPSLQDNSEPQAQTPAVDWALSLEKEILLSISDIGLDEQSELDAIEDWYRDVDIHADIATIEVDPLRSHPASTTTTAAAVEIPPPPTHSPPPPPPPPPRPLGAASQPALPEDDPELSEMRRTTPKLRAPPPGRALALKLQTTFVDKKKPVRGAKITSPTDQAAKAGDASPPPRGQQRQQRRQQQQQQQQEERDDREGEQGGEEEEEEEEEELTARPHSAVKSFANVRCWTESIIISVVGGGGGGGGGNGNGKGVSIDELLHGGGPGDDHQQQQQQEEDRVGPMTPNGYDDISPITRGEWGMLMFGGNLAGRTAKVETC